MGKVRRCDAQCHDAKGPDCGCWCGGRFHGAAGAEARQAFLEAWTEAENEDEERYLAWLFEDLRP